MTAPSRDEDDTRTGIRALSERVDAGFKTVHARIAEIDRGVERRSSESLSRFERHTKDDERRFDGIEKRLDEMKAESKEMRTELRTDISAMGAETKAQTAKLDALLLKDAGQTGKIAGAVAGVMAVAGVVVWLINTFIVHH